LRSAHTFPAGALAGGAAQRVEEEDAGHGITILSLKNDLRG
jgi:hypothetical protein